MLYKNSKRDIKASNQRLIAESNHRLVSYDGKISFKNYLRINNEKITAKDVALMVKETFDL